MFSFFRRRHFEALASAKAKTEALASAKAKICISVTANLEHLAAERRQGLFLDNSGNVDGIQWNSACQNFMERVVLPLLTDREAKAVVDAGLSSVATELVELPVRLECQRVGQYPARRPIVWPRSKLELVEPDHFLKISKISMPVNCFAESVVQRGLIIRPEPLQKILYGIKT